ncbi:MAG: hypothetical protein QOF94_2656, partial [Acidobacteriaceae bacterium]
MVGQDVKLLVGKENGSLSPKGVSYPCGVSFILNNLGFPDSMI